MIEDNDDIRPHDWLEADEMVDALLDGANAMSFNVNI